MRTFALVSCLVAVAVAQFPPSGLRESQHFQAINQPHLPKDTNVLQATRQFLDKFAELKALADAAPDPVPAGRQPQAARQQFAPAQQNFAPAPHRFAAPQPAAAPVPPHAAHKDFDVNSEIKTLLARHQAANPNRAPTAAPRRQFQQAQFQQAPAQPQRTPAQPQRAPAQPQRAPAFPTFNVHNNFAAQRPQQPQVPRFTQAQVQAVQPNNANVQTHNKQGQIINPTKFPGPLAHTVPAGVTGRVQATQFTPEVAAAHRALASAHANILAQQAALPRPVQ